MHHIKDLLKHFYHIGDTDVNIMLAFYTHFFIPNTYCLQTKKLVRISFL